MGGSACIPSTCGLFGDRSFLLWIYPRFWLRLCRCPDGDSYALGLFLRAQAWRLGAADDRHRFFALCGRSDNGIDLYRVFFLFRFLAEWAGELCGDSARLFPT